jgi:hypothetical protein
VIELTYADPVTGECLFEDAEDEDHLDNLKDELRHQGYLLVQERTLDFPTGEVIDD